MILNPIKDNEQIKNVFDPQIFQHHDADNQEIREISVDRREKMIQRQDVLVRTGVAGILEEANKQMSHGLGANFGVRNAGMPAIAASDIDVSDGEALRSTLESAREEMTINPDAVPTTTLKCIAKRLRPNGRTWVKCKERTVKGDMYCPLHLQVNKVKAYSKHKNIKYG